ncbi:MAG: hypothetical protein LBB26_04045 [Puniceicoccales bacterium]|jgi:hypothetical protein|nr:hypothetical protein [Puniceicoccales bacterium]
MKSNTVTAAAADIFDHNRGLQMSPIQGLTPGLKLEPSFSRKFPTFLERASPLPVNVRMPNYKLA